MKTLIVLTVAVMGWWLVSKFIGGEKVEEKKRPKTKKANWKSKRPPQL